LNNQNLEGTEYTEGDWSIIDGDSRYLTKEEKEEKKSQPNYYNDTVSVLHLPLFILFFFFFLLANRYYYCYTILIILMPDTITVGIACGNKGRT
jgi:hypothetical protein